MGVVWLAQQSEPVKRRLALKIIKLGLDTKEVLARFESERQALAVMDHPSIARVYDGGITPAGRPFFVMELVQGVPITDFCDTNKLDTRSRIRLFIRLCSAVQHAHQKGVIHRDLKPSNILVSDRDGSPEPRIIDFGVSKAVSYDLTDRTLVTRMGQLVGTPEYMSPEQAEMSGLDVDTRTDIYSLGIVLYELLVGVRPLDLSHKSDFALVHAIRETDIAAPSARLTTLGDTGETVARYRGTTPEALRREMKGDLDWIVLKATEKDRSRRYETANGLAMDLERYLGREPVMARPPSTSYKLHRFVQRNRVGVLAGGIAALALLVGSVTAAVGLVRARAAEAEARAAERLATEEASATREVSDFLVSLFEVNTPSEARGNSITAREILDRGSARIEAELTDQPAVKARLMSTLGAVYGSLALSEPAEEMLRGAVSLMESDPSTPPARLAQELVRLGSTTAFRGNGLEGDSLIGRALGLLDPPQEYPAEIRSALHALASVRMRVLGELASADTLLQRALRIAEDRWGPDSREAATTLSHLAFLHDDDPSYAEPLQRRILAIRQAEFGWDHPATASVAHDLALTLSSMGPEAMAEALELMGRVLSFSEGYYGTDHPRVADVLSDQGLLYLEEARFPDAVAVLSRSTDIRLRALGEEDPGTGYDQHLLARALLGVGEVEQSEQVVLAAMRKLESGFGRGHSWTAQALTTLAAARAARGDPDQAELMLREAVDSQKRNWGANHRLVHRPTLILAGVLAGSGQPTRADSAYAAAMVICDTMEHGERCFERTASAWIPLLQSLGRSVQADSLRGRLES